MKNIFVPTDFSACASFAVEVSMQLAHYYEAKLHLYSCLDLPWNWQTMAEEERARNPEALQKIANADTLFEKIKTNNPTLEIIATTSGGSLLENITDYVKNCGIDILIMGSYGASGKNEFFIGSNTQKAVRLVHCPVLVIKNKIEKLRFDKVVFASSFNEDEKESFKKFLKIITPFKPEIHLLAVHTSEFFGAPYILQNAAMNDFMELGMAFSCEKHIMSDFSVDAGVRFFADEIGADLVAISNHHRHPLKRMLVGSNVEAIVNHSDLPVLTIDY